MVCPTSSLIKVYIASKNAYLKPFLYISVKVGVGLFDKRFLPFCRYDTLPTTGLAVNVTEPVKASTRGKTRSVRFQVLRALGDVTINFIVNPFVVVLPVVMAASPGESIQLVSIVYLSIGRPAPVLHLHSRARKFSSGFFHGGRRGYIHHRKNQLIGDINCVSSRPPRASSSFSTHLEVKYCYGSRANRWQSGADVNTRATCVTCWIPWFEAGTTGNSLLRY